jgi:hypothetical protein
MVAVPSCSGISRSAGGEQLYARLAVGGLGDGITALAERDCEDFSEEIVVIEEPT